MTVSADSAVPLAQRRLDLSRPFRILVTGSRVWERPGVIHRALDEAARDQPGGIVVVHGQCDPRTVEGKVVPWADAELYRGVLLGADWHAHRYAVASGWVPEAHPANWAVWGATAGPARNLEMVRLSADVCLGFPLGDSRGTRNCLRTALDHHIPLRTYEG